MPDAVPHESTQLGSKGLTALNMHILCIINTSKNPNRRIQHMRRHPHLQPLSREHHQTLRLARDLQRAIDPAEHTQAVRAHHTNLLDHFAEEERDFETLTDHLPDSHEVRTLLQRMLIEHRQLRELLDRLAGGGTSIGPDEYRRLGQMLSEHVAFEERQLFPALQDCCLILEPSS